MKIPKRYEDLTVDQFQKLEELKTNTSLDKLDRAVLRLSILSGKSIDYIESLNATLVYNTLMDAVFLTQPITQIETPKEVKLGGIKFRYIKEIHEYNIAQEKDWKEMVKNSDNNYINCLPELMAVCHQEYENGKWVYNSNNHQRNVDLFRHSKLSESLGAVFFYSKTLTSYTKVLADSLVKATATIQEIQKEMTDDLEFQTFLKGGVGSTQSV
jgi:hypothetical protein